MIMILNTITTKDSDFVTDHWIIIMGFKIVSKKTENIKGSGITRRSGCVTLSSILRKICDLKGCVTQKLTHCAQSPATDLNKKSADALPPHGKEGFTFNCELILVLTTQAVMFNPNRNRKIRPRRSRAMNPQFENSSSSEEAAAQVHTRPQSHILAERAERNAGNTDNANEATEAIEATEARRPCSHYAHFAVSGQILSRTSNDSEGNKIKLILLIVTKSIFVGINCIITRVPTIHIPNLSLYLTSHGGGEIMGMVCGHVGGLSNLKF